MNNRTIAPIMSFTIAAAVSALAFHDAPEAQAATLRNHSSICTSKNPYYDSVGYNSSTNDLASSTYNAIYCPFVEFDTFKKNQVATLNVYIQEYDTSGMVLVNACWSDYAGSTGSCGTASYSSVAGTGNYTLTPGLGSWNTTAGSAYLSFDMPNALAYVEGFYLST